MQIGIFAYLAVDRVQKVFALLLWTDPISSGSDQFEMVAWSAQGHCPMCRVGEKGGKYEAGLRSRL